MKTATQNGPEAKQTPPSRAPRPPAHVRKAEPLLTIPEAAEILNVSTKQVRRYIAEPEARKRLRSIKIGRLRRIDPVDLEDFIRVRRRP